MTKKNSAVVLFLIGSVFFVSSQLFSNEKKVVENYKFRDNFKLVFHDFNVIVQDYSFENNSGNETVKKPLLSSLDCIEFIFCGGICFGGSFILTGLGIFDIAFLYNKYKSDNTANLFIIIGGVCLGVAGLVLIGGILFMAIGASVYAKYYQTNKVSFFIGTKDNKTDFGFSLKI